MIIIYSNYTGKPLKLRTKSSYYNNIHKPVKLTSKINCSNNAQKVRKFSTTASRLSFTYWPHLLNMMG